MRILILLFLSLFLGKSCGHVSKKTAETAVIVYEANTKGYYGKVIVQNRTVSVSKQRGNSDTKITKMSDADWNYLVDQVKKTDLEGMSKLKSPSEKRYYDGAATADIIITIDGKNYQSTPFDHRNPPAEIKDLVNKIVSFLNEN